MSLRSVSLTVAPLSSRASGYMGPMAPLVLPDVRFARRRGAAGG
jgi:hypothetical protein